jgi:hypothetical protein
MIDKPIPTPAPVPAVASANAGVANASIRKNAYSSMVGKRIVESLQVWVG